MGIEVHLLTGDGKRTAETVAAMLDIRHYKADVLPSDKEEYIRSLQAARRKVAMVGDGINDSQALARADVSIAMGKGYRHGCGDGHVDYFGFDVIAGCDPLVETYGSLDPPEFILGIYL